VLRRGSQRKPKIIILIVGANSRRSGLIQGWPNKVTSKYYWGEE
jgi:hypothetical protein